MTDIDAVPSFRSYLVVLRRRKWWVAGAALLGVAVSMVYVLSAPNEYAATSQVLVQSTTATPTTPGSAAMPVTQTDVQTELTLVTSAPVASRVAHELGTVPAVTASEVGQTNVIAITATDTSPVRAAAVANAYAHAFVGYEQSAATSAMSTAEAQVRAELAGLARQLYKLRGRAERSSPQAAALLNQQVVLKEQLAQMQVSGAVNVGGVEVVTPAEPPASPSSPRPARDALLGLAVGLLVGLGAAYFRDNLDDRLISKDAVEQAAGAPALSLVPLVPSWRRRQKAMLVSVSDPTSPTAEAYRSLRTSLQFCQQDSNLRTLLVTSPAASEGKTSTLANLGVVFSQVGDRVLLVSCDLRRPRLGEFFEVSEESGITTVLLGQRPLKEVIQPVPGHDRLWLLPAGSVPPNPAEMLNRPGAKRLFEALKENFDLVLIDSPPVLPVTDAVVLAQHADATLLVIAAGQTRRGEVRRAAEKLAQVHVAPLGLVLNQVNKQAGYSYSYGDGYGYGYTATYKPYAPPARAAAGDALADQGHPMNDVLPDDGRVHANGKTKAADSSAR